MLFGFFLRLNPFLPGMGKKLVSFDHSNALTSFGTMLLLHPILLISPQLP